MTATTNVHQAPLEVLLAALEDFASDRRRDGKLDRSAGALEAAEDLRAGADEARFEHSIYRVGEDDRYALCEGTLAEIQRELADAVTGWYHNGRADLALKSTNALAAVIAGDTSVRVGHIVYSVR